MRTAKRILAEFMTVVMVLQACSPTVAAVAAGWQNISSEIAAASAVASNAAESGETKNDAATGSGPSDAGADSDGAGDGAAKDDTASGDTADVATGSDSTGDQTEADNAVGDTTADDAEQDADAAASEDVETQADATITNLDDLVTRLEANGAENIVRKDNGSGIQSLDVKVSTAFTVLSNADASLYYDAQININMSGDAKLTEPADNGRLSFQGFGSDAHPFEGKIYRSNSPNDPVELTSDRTAFNNLKLTDQNNKVKIKWVGATNYSEPMVASKVIGEGKELNATVSIADPVSTDENNDKTSALTAPLLGETTGDLTVNVTYSLTGSRKNLNVNAVSNIGLLANTVKSGTFAVGSVAFPDNLAAGVVKTSSGNAGLLVGAVEDGATLNVGTLPDVPAATVQSESGSAGGVVGLVGSSAGATVNVTGALDLNALTVKGTTASGGFIGKATKLTLGADNKKFTCPAAVGDASSACSGGAIGDVSFAQEFTVKPGMFDLGDGVTLGATRRAGALFGVADITHGDIVVQGGMYKSKLASGEDGGASGSYGGLVGKVFAVTTSDDGALRALVVQKDAGNKCAIEFNLASGLSDAGGVVGYVGDSADPNSQPVAVVLNGVKVTSKGDASARTGAGKLGGAVGVVDTRNVLDVRDFTLTSENPIGKVQSNRAAGIAGSAWNAVIKFSGITDLSGASFAENGTTGQLVYENNNALIFAAGDGSNGELTDKGAIGWTFKRSNTVSKTDDIATYGEVIRLGRGLSESFITLDPNTHVFTLPASLESANSAYTLTSVEDFAKLAITWQTNGYYPMVTGVSDNNLSGLQSSTITVNGTIDLRGTGLTGFTQDRADGSQIFSGTLNGNGKINLAVGEPYGKRGEDKLGESDASNGNGKIYRHGRLGLFNAIGGAVKVSNLTIGGFMKFDNGLSVDAGSLAASISSTAGNGVTLSGVTCETNIKCDDTFGNDANIGGIAGSVSAAATVGFNDGTRAKATIATGNTLNGNTRIGGAIGYVGDVSSTFNVTGLEVAGSIKAGDCPGGKIAQVGGLIGCITQGSQKKNVGITGLGFDRFDMTVGKNGDKLNGAGGLLGYSWGNAVVTIGGNADDGTYALKTSDNTTVTVNNSTEVGGLVYAASGHWVINDYAVDLSDATINADKATVLGLLIGRGGRTENSSTYGVETYSGLYLENRASWDTAYKVNGAAAGNGVKINNTAIKSDDSATSFDEWVGNGTKPAYGNEAGSKLIDGEWNVVVSLHTKDNVNGGKLDMSGEPGSDNSYQNRSAFGNNHKTNAWTRYYYNLDIAYAEVGNNEKNSSASSWMNSAEYLLLWCAYLYAPSAIQDYIIPGNQAIFQGNNIGTSDSAGVEINLDGYSFYPTDPARGSTVTVNNATITFHYSDIKAEQEGNKKNSEATQHENMHCALIGTHTGSLKVKNVTLAGTVGSIVNDAGSSSGALVCCCIYGPVNETNVAQLEIDGLTLDGLKVDGVNGNTSYAPLLINEMQTRVNLSAKNISTRNYANGATAATSLFGKLGVGKNADQVTATFNRISVPSATGQNATNRSIFTRASLLESFGYGEGKTGSAVYTFLKDDQGNNKVTFGKEIDSTDSEYSGKQLWYYDEATYGTVKGFVKVKDESADAERPWFGDYLPYVAKGKATENGVQYHEIKVNQRIPNFVTGCGTYGDPYVITSASELNAAANYINNGTALDGWEVTIAKDQSMLCQRRNDGSTENEVTYVYRQANGATKKWEKKAGDATDPNDVLSDDTMRRYLQSAYYSIEPKSGTNNTIELDGSAFAGFGTSAYPFRGVIVGDLGGATATIEINNNTGSLRGLIPYSYGSVVRNLNITYSDATALITYAPKNSDGVPGAFFGGVIGCIMGGDNIIDGVTVSSDHFVVAGAKGDKGGAHLVPVGGYVGAIAGGGVIFRNMDKNDNSSWRAGTSDKSRGLGKGNFGLYDNPYVGRVIDGYAFSEGCAVDNGDANYKINKLDVSDTGCVTTTDTHMKYSWSAGQQNNNAPQTTVKDSQGLLVLSAIINSGAGAGAAHTDEVNNNGTYRGSHAYEGSNIKGAISSTGYKFGNERYGKVRNANYTAVGKPADATAASDFQTSTNDDLKAPGNQEYQGALDSQDGQDINSPYLVKKYATDWRTGYVCATGVCGMDLKFEQGVICDMTGYGSGFLGLSGRYYSNACVTDKKVNDKDFITPGIATINGNGATIKVSNNTREYVDDDYNVAGVGGLFSTIKFYSSAYNKGSIEANDNASVSNLNFKNCNISLTYISSTGVEQSTSGSNGKSGWVGAGCLAGSTANQGGSSGAYGVFKNVDISNSAVAGGCMAGGLIGSAGLMTRSTDGSNASIVNYGGTSSPVQLYDCSYSGITVSARSNAGGFVGYINSGVCGVWVSNDKTVADSSTISIVEKARDSRDSNSTAGGIFGLTGGYLSVNTGQGDGASQVATISDVSLIINHNALGVGGIAGRTVTRDSSVNRVKVTSTKKASENTPTYFGSLQAVANISNAYAISTGGIIGSTSNKVTLNSCMVENLRMGVTEHAGGLVGATSNGNTLSATNITVDGVQFDGARCGGILGNCQGQGGTNVVVSNATVKNCSFGTLNSTWKHDDGSLRNHSGGIVGAASGTIKIVNVLISKNDFKQPGGQGFLLGDTAQSASDFRGLYAAGVDIVLKDGSDSSSAPKPVKYFNNNAVANVNRKSYIAFGAYGNTVPESPKGKTLYGRDGGATVAVSPYVTTSPTSGLAVRTSDGSEPARYLFGDGMNVNLAENIKNRAGSDVDSRYIYTNIGGINADGAYQKTSSYDASSVASKFNANNDSSENKVQTDFPVLVISGTDNTTVTSYLNIITNGGFSDACRLNGTDITKAHVTAKAEVFQLKNGVFVKDEEASNNPTLRVVNNGKKNMSFSPSSDWDNGKGRFTLLTVTFTEAGQSYNVQVPIIVKRKLEIDFTATYDYGTNFKENNYAQLGKDAHVLTSFGEPMTGLLTWTYNSAKGTEVDFGWDSYMAAGGSMKGLGKSILFDGADGRLPQGTQLTLVDANVDGKAGGREYHYKVGEGGATSVSLSGDNGFKDSADKPYQERWLSEILDVSATKDGAGTWTVCDNEADATAKAKLDGKWTLFKVAGADVPGDKRYKLTVPKDNGKEKRASESVYLVVNVPKSAGVSKINGFTNTPGIFDSSSSRVAVNMHRVLRPNNASGGKDPDIQNNTASTYSILSNYGQEIVDNEGKARTLVPQSQDGAAYVLSLDVTDRITFNTDQIYATNDSLFYQLDTSLCKYDANDTLKGVSSFPSGTSAIAEFYVAIGSQNYTWDSAGKKWVTCDASTPAFTQTVTDTGNDSLKLTLEHNLAGIRALANGSFTVRTVVKEIRLTPDGCNDVIALSQQSGEEACTKMSYIAKLSTRKSGLDTSSLAVTTRGNVGYYRMNKGGATITLSAPDKSQLGINVDDLRPIADGTIGLGATYEVGGLSNDAEAIASAGSVVYTLKLQRRSGTDGSYEDVTGKISDYVTVTESKLATVNAADSAITFTDSTKENGKFRTQNGDTTFNLPFTVKVNTQVEQGGQFYANYRLVMTASLVTNDVASATPQSPDYVTYTLTRVNLNGIDH